MDAPVTLPANANMVTVNFRAWSLPPPLGATHPVIEAAAGGHQRRAQADRGDAELRRWDPRRATPTPSPRTTSRAPPPPTRAMKTEAKTARRLEAATDSRIRFEEEIRHQRPPAASDRPVSRGRLPLAPALRGRTAPCRKARRGRSARSAAARMATPRARREPARSAGALPRSPSWRGYVGGGFDAQAAAAAAGGRATRRVPAPRSRLCGPRPIEPPCAARG